MDKEVKSVEKFDLMTSIINCMTFILSVALKPVNAFKSRIKDYSSFKSAGILVLFVSLAEMIINLLGKMISVIFVKQIVFFTGDTKLSISFENLKTLDYFDLVVKHVFWSILIIAAVAGIYYIVALIMKKECSYFRLASITAVSFVPVCVVSFVGIIISYIYAPLSYFLGFASFIYSLFIFINAINSEVEFKNADYKVYFHTICLTVIFIISYYILSNEISSMFNFNSLIK